MPSIHAQWTSVFEDTNPKFFNDISYVSDNEAFAHNNKRIIYRTRDNWKSFIEIPLKGADRADIVYFKMLSSTKGILITQMYTSSNSDSVLIYATHNGGCDWEKVYRMPDPVPAKNYTRASEPVLVDMDGDEFYVNWANVVAHGSLEQNSWEYELYEVQRQRPNREFYVFSEKYWVFFDGVFSYYTENAGEWWLQDNTQKFRKMAGLGDGHQRVIENRIEEFDEKFGQWVSIAQIPAASAESIRKLNEQFALFYFYDWQVGHHRTAVFNYDTKKFIEHDTVSVIYTFNNEVAVKPSGFVMRDMTVSLIESNDFGKSWNTIFTQENVAQNFFNRNIIQRDSLLMVDDWQNVFYTVDGGKNWIEMTKSILGMTPENARILNIDPNSTLISSGREGVIIFSTEDDLLFGTEKSYMYKDTSLMHANMIINEAWGNYLAAGIESRFYLFEVGQNDELEVAHVMDVGPFLINDPVAQMIQTETEIFIWIQRKLYRFNKVTSEMLELGQLYNIPESYDFWNDSLLYIKTAAELISLNLATNELVDDVFPDQYKGLYWLPAVSAISSDELVFSNGSQLIKMEAGKSPEWYLDFNIPLQIYDMALYHDKMWVLASSNLYYYDDTYRAHEKIELKVKSVWPNPFHSKIYYEIESGYEMNYTIRVINSQGRICDQTDKRISTGVYELYYDLSHLPSGFYIVQFVYEDQIVTEKMIKN
ncbi:T9SS type A sorting domain-containing protein [bacterium]|nr:T9SS type A sorting domain-containing protein [bacterium]